MRIWRHAISKKLPLGIAWEDDAIRVVELLKSGRGFQVKAASFPLPDGVFQDGKLKDSNGLVDILKTIRIENNWDKKNVVTAFHGKQVIIRYLKLPQMSLENLEKAVEWEADQILGVDRKEYSFDYMVLGQGLEVQGKERIVLFTAILRQVALDFYHLFSRAGFRLKAIDVTPLALIRALVSKERFNEKDQGIILLDLGTGGSQLAIVFQGQLIFARSLSFCLPKQKKIIEQSMPWLEKENVVELEGRYDQGCGVIQHMNWKNWNWLSNSKELLTEVRRTLDYFQTQYHEMSVEQVIVSGSGCTWPGLEYLYQDLGLRVEKGVPGHGLSLDFYPDPSFAVALGLALKGVRI